MEGVRAETVKRLAARCGFELAGVAPAVPLPEFAYYRDWVAQGMAGAMGYLTDHRGELRQDPRLLLPTARSVICVGKLYNGPEPCSTRFSDPDLGWISRYAWGDDYHSVLKDGLEHLLDELHAELDLTFDSKVCVDTAPLLERALARRAGLGWIGKNTCLINQQGGSWFFLGELLVSLEIEPDSPPPDRCGTCTRCIDACPTAAIVPVAGENGPAWAVDSRLCISYYTIEFKGAAPEEIRPGFGSHVFGCDICQDVCPWNRRAPITSDPAFAPRMLAPPLEDLAALTEEEFRRIFRDSPVARPKYRGFLRNVAVAMGNSGLAKFREPLGRMAQHTDPVVAETARWALGRIEADAACPR
ncbi:MAG: tRNA epoxyqueuosine(34) reductase QueG [Bryobacteraceae bacterium]